MPLAKAVSQKVSQLQAERAAAQEPFRVQTDLLDQKLKETLGRFRGGSVADAWWRQVLTQMQQAYVAPDFFKMPAVRSWLDEVLVQEDIVSLARPNVMGQMAEGEDEVRKRLSEIYSAAYR